ncbi:MAG: putative signal transducing protein [Verrucomicrobiota bacterium]|jgi:hypothetical protein
MEPVVIFRTFSVAEADVVRASLESAGFHARLTNELASLSIDGYSMAAGGIRVVVPAEEAADARALIEANQNPPAEGAE